MYVPEEKDQEMKDITLRGVNSELYSSFSEFRTKYGLSSGDAFNAIIFASIRQPWRIHGLRPKRHHPRHGKMPEIISDIDNLTITKKDLTSAGDEIMFLFRNIGKLTFEKDVDGSILVKHVKLISSSDVVFKGDVPKLIQAGIIRSKIPYTHPNEKQLLKDITIRNVSSMLYDEFISKAKGEGCTTGEYFSRLLVNILPIIEILDARHGAQDKEILLVKAEEELSVSKQDLELIGDRCVIFYGVGKLTFAKNIPQELFLRTVLKIISCKELILPENIPRLIALSRTSKCPKTNIN